MDKLITIFKVPELRRKILFTALLLAIYRIGFYVPLPIVNQRAVEKLGRAAERQHGRQALRHGRHVRRHLDRHEHDLRPGDHALHLGVDHLSASGQRRPIARSDDEGGRKRPEAHQRIHPLRHRRALRHPERVLGAVHDEPTDERGACRDITTFWNGFVCVCIMTAGTIFLMWIGEQIDEYGIGNGISLLIMAGILARLPVAITGPNGLWYNSTSKLNAEPGKYGITTILLLIGLFIAVVVGVIAITESQRRIPTQSAKHVRGRRVFGGTKQFLPLKVNQAGVMPIIFASSLLIFPSFVFSSLERATTNLQSDRWTIGSFFAGLFRELADAFQRQSYIYTVCYVILIYFFCYFWTAITFNPKDMAENLKDLGSFIPGYRPGRRTADYLEKVMLRITYVGAAFLALVAVIPSLVQSALGVDWTVASFLGGTGLLIVISVCLDLVQKIDSHLVMRSYTGLVNRQVSR